MPDDVLSMARRKPDILMMQRSHGGRVRLAWLLLIAVYWEFQ
jgi:hypothetical protein